MAGWSNKKSGRWYKMMWFNFAWAITRLTIAAVLNLFWICCFLVSCGESPFGYGAVCPRSPLLVPECQDCFSLWCRPTLPTECVEQASDGVLMDSQKRFSMPVCNLWTPSVSNIHSCRNLCHVICAKRCWWWWSSFWRTMPQRYALITLITVEWVLSTFNGGQSLNSCFNLERTPWIHGEGLSADPWWGPG